MRLGEVMSVDEMFRYFNERGVGLIQTGNGTFKLVKGGLNVKSSIFSFCNGSDGKGYFVCYESPTAIQLIRRKDIEHQPEQGVMAGLYVIDTIRNGFGLADII